MPQLGTAKDDTVITGLTGGSRYAVCKLCMHNKVALNPSANMCSALFSLFFILQPLLHISPPFSCIAAVRYTRLLLAKAGTPSFSPSHCPCFSIRRFNCSLPRGSYGSRQRSPSRTQGQPLQRRSSWINLSMRLQLSSL